MESKDDDKKKYEKLKEIYKNNIKTHEENKDAFIKNGDYVKAKKENQKIENFKNKLKKVEEKSKTTVKEKEFKQLKLNFDTSMNDIKSNYESKIKVAETDLQNGIKELNKKYKKDLNAIEKNFYTEQKPSSEFKALEKEEQELLKKNLFDEAIAVQKMKKKQGEADKAKFLLSNKMKLEALKRNLTEKHNKDLNNFKENCNNNIELMKNEMNRAMDNLCKQYNNRRHDLMNIQGNNNLYKTNPSLAKSREMNIKSAKYPKKKYSIKRLIGPMTTKKLEPSKTTANLLKKKKTENSKNKVGKKVTANKK